MQDNTQNNRNLAIGDHVWFNMPYAGPSVGTIIAFIDKDIEKEYAKIHIDRGGTTIAPLTSIYTSSEALFEANKKASDERIARYKTKMPDVEGLVRFMFDNTVSSGAEEYTDWDARQAVSERAKELLGIDLD